MDYASLQTSIAAWLNRDDLSSYIPESITLAEAEFQRTIRAREMLRNADTTTSVVSVQLPSDFLELRHITLTSENQPLYYATLAELDDIRRNVQVAAQPTHVAVYNTKLELAPVPDKQYTLEIVYYQKIPELSSNTSTNWLIAAYPDVYLYGCLTKAAPFIGEDERTNVWRQEYTNAVNQLNIISERTELRGARKSLAYKYL